MNKILVFFRYALFSIITLGVYPFYFYVTRTELHTKLLSEILDELKKKMKSLLSNDN